ncbi:MAG: M1 family metallopeptidase, partial [Cyclobacteriaceae bacterium]
MDIYNVSLFKKGEMSQLKFDYDNYILSIQLDKVYEKSENYTVYIDYKAKPYEFENGERKEKGLNFINTDGKYKNKPIQIWTKGQPENNSIWFPTIDKPNQKTTQEISISVPEEYVTLSNGTLISQTDIGNGERKDTWKMNLPNSPYLFMMAIGDFKIIKDEWKGKEVSYYLEPAYAPFARDIFGETTEAMDFFSEILDFDYPWSKYSQIIVRDYPGGAMENTTATVFDENTQGTKKELADRYYHTGIQHELFHQWFGNYVTAESWSNLTLNESMAEIAQYLWLEYKYDRDIADAYNFWAMRDYLKTKEAYNKHLVRYGYSDVNEVFDVVSYKKGSSILNMLMRYIGKEAFLNGLNLYLRQNALKSAEAHHLRLAMESVSGIDLNWFFNQWYFGSGHPKLDISYDWNEETKTQKIILLQTQKDNVFKIPLAIDFYFKNGIEQKNVWLTHKADTLIYKFSEKALLINVDAEKTLIAEKTDHKTLDEFEYQYFNAPLFIDRYEAMEKAVNNPEKVQSRKIILSALEDNYFGLRIEAINHLDSISLQKPDYPVQVLQQLALNDKNNIVKAKAIECLGKLKLEENLPIFRQSLKTESYSVQGASLLAIGQLDPIEAIGLSKQFDNDRKYQVYDAYIFLNTRYGKEDEWNDVFKMFMQLSPPKKFNMIKDFGIFTGRIENNELAKR